MSNDFHLTPAPATAATAATPASAVPQQARPAAGDSQAAVAAATLSQGERLETHQVDTATPLSGEVSFNTQQATRGAKLLAGMLLAKGDQGLINEFARALGISASDVSVLRDGALTLTDDNFRNVPDEHVQTMSDLGAPLPANASPDERAAAQATKAAQANGFIDAIAAAIARGESA